MRTISASWEKWARAAKTLQSNRDVDGGDFTIAQGLSGFDNVEAREESGMIGESVAVESQLTAHLLEHVRDGLIATLLSVIEKVLVCGGCEGKRR
jgi:hypothetical protein